MTSDQLPALKTCEGWPSQPWQVNEHKTKERRLKRHLGKHVAMAVESFPYLLDYTLTQGVRGPRPEDSKPYQKHQSACELGHTLMRYTFYNEPSAYDTSQKNCP